MFIIFVTAVSVDSARATRDKTLHSEHFLAQAPRAVSVVALVVITRLEIVQTANGTKLVWNSDCSMFCSFNFSVSSVPVLPVFFVCFWPVVVVNLLKSA